MYVCVLNQTGDVLLHRNLQCEPALFLAAIGPYREDLVVGVECIFNWYWVADLCAKEGIAFVLGHALYMRVIHRRDGAESAAPGARPITTASSY